MSTPKKSKKIKPKQQTKRSTKPKKEQVKKIYPDRPDIWEQAGFESDGKKHTHTTHHYPYKNAKQKITIKSHWWSGGKAIILRSKKIDIIETYKTRRGKAFKDIAYYKALFFGGTIEASIIPLTTLHDYLLHQSDLDNAVGKWYDKISLREGDRDIWGGEKGLDWMCDSAEELLLFLDQYKRRGSLIGEGGSFTNIQVCYIQLEN